MRNDNTECLLITFHSCTSADIDEKSTGKIDTELSLMSSQSASASTSSIWYIDSGASSHMTGIKQYFTNLTEIGLDLEVVLGEPLSQGCWTRNYFFSKGSWRIHEAKGCPIGSWIKEKLGVSFYYRGYGILGDVSRWTCAHTS